MRKKQVLLSCLLMLIGVSMSAQTSLKAQSLYDVNQDDKVNVSDVTTVVKKVAENASTDKTVVDTEALLKVLNALNAKIEALSTSLAKVKTKLGIEDEPSHAYVEIGGLKWATMNLGATTVAGSPSTCYGDYYAWGETEPRYTSITITDAESVSFGGWSSSYDSGYSGNPSYKGETLDADHDAATKAWGSAWRTPTRADFQALAKACTGSTASPQNVLTLSTSDPTGGIYWLSSDQTYLSDYSGVAGILFVDKTDTSKRVFFPAAGRCINIDFSMGGMYGYYWSSSLYTSDTRNAYFLGIHSSSVYPSDSSFRYLGSTVRPVSD